MRTAAATISVQLLRGERCRQLLSRGMKSRTTVTTRRNAAVQPAVPKPEGYDCARQRALWCQMAELESANDPPWRLPPLHSVGEIAHFLVRNIVAAERISQFPLHDTH